MCKPGTLQKIQFGIIQVKTWWKIGEQIDVKSVEKLVENSVEKSVEKSVKKISGKIDGKIGGKIGKKKPVKKSVKKSVENRWRKSKNVTDGPKDQRTDLHLTCRTCRYFQSVSQHDLSTVPRCNVLSPWANPWDPDYFEVAVPNL